MHQLHFNYLKEKRFCTVKVTLALQPITPKTVQLAQQDFPSTLHRNPSHLRIELRRIRESRTLGLTGERRRRLPSGPLGTSSSRVRGERVVPGPFESHDSGSWTKSSRCRHNVLRNESGMWGRCPQNRGNSRGHVEEEQRVSGPGLRTRVMQGPGVLACDGVGVQGLSPRDRQGLGRGVRGGHRGRGSLRLGIGGEGHEPEVLVANGLGLRLSLGLGLGLDEGMEVPKRLLGLRNARGHRDWGGRSVLG